VLVALANLLVASTADAQSTRQRRAEARERFQKGVELYETGDVRAALIEFKRAYKAMPNFRLLYNMAQAASELKEYVEAYDYYLQYLEAGGGRIDTERRREVRDEIRRLEGYLASVRIRVSEPGAEIAIDGTVVGVSPLREAVIVSAGRREIVVTRQGYAPWQRRIDFAGRVTETVRVELISLSSSRSDRDGDLAMRPRDRGEKESSTDAVFWTAAAVTTFLAVGTGYAAYRTLEARDEYEFELGRVPNTVESINDASDRAQRFALLTDVGIGLTVVSLTATILLARRDRSPQRERRAVRLQVTPERVAVMGEWRY